MAPITEDQVEKVRALVAAIPAGRVSTYGDLAEEAELSSPRIVAWIMRTDSSDLPWHRVIPASGRPAPHLATRHRSCRCSPIRRGEHRPESPARWSS
ncbi:MGMT family protein [Mycolicibacterium diernhoferi]|uniref:MGMT family protein n=1 Tax=Mycolicibacterium diernhoferi TaxID=1801 RepID=UPI0009A22C49|nr:MGMT family protein [Mycolicibacterium diernhoferi]